MNSLTDQWLSELAERDTEKSGEPTWLNALRQAGAIAFKKYGLPHRKVEDWKYTSLKLLEARSHKLVGQTGSAANAGTPPVPQLLLDQGCTTIRLINGRPESGFQPPQDVEVISLEQAMADRERDPSIRKTLESLEIEGAAKAFSALNNSMLGRGLVIDVPAGTQGGIVQLQWAFDDAPPAMLFNSRVMVRLGEGASLTLVEQFESKVAHAHGLNLVTQVDVGPGAKLSHIRWQQESADAALLTRMECDVHGQGSYEFALFDCGGGLVRHDSQLTLSGPGAHGTVNGAFVLDGKQHIDHHVFIDHAAGDTASNQFFRGVLGGHSRGVFNGKARIQQGADGSSIRQSNANLLLSDMAQIDTKPELEIYADEVEASHGATVGQLDEDAVFYMRTRGLNEDQARGMLTSAFCKAVLDRTPDLPALLGQAIERRLDNALSKVVGSRTAP